MTDVQKYIFRSDFITLILSDYVPEAQDVPNPERPRDRQEGPAQAYEAEH